MAKKCRICAAANAKTVPPRKHKCSVNWTGSAKVMEPAMACQMLKNVEHVPSYEKFNSNFNDCLFNPLSNPVNSFVLMNSITKSCQA